MSDQTTPAEGDTGALTTPVTEPRPTSHPRVVTDCRVTVPAGAYYLGDPCYVFHNDERGSEQWSALLDDSDYFGAGGTPEGGPLGFVEVPVDPAHPEDSALTRLPVVAFRTAYGDGGYEDREGHSYSVDAGMIGLVPAWWAVANALTAESGPADGLRYLTTNARFVVFTTEVQCTKGGPDEGLLTFGPVEIPTHHEPDPCYVCGRDTDAAGYCGWGCQEDDEDDEDEQQ